MKKITKQAVSRLSTIATAIIAAYSPASFADDMAQYIDPDNSISIGYGHWSTDRPQAGTYDRQGDSGGYGVIDADVKKLDRETGTWVGLNAKGLGLDPSVRLEYLKQGNHGYVLQFDRITRDDPNAVYSRLQGYGSTRQVVNNSTATGGSEFGLELRRDVTSLGYYRNLAEGLDFDVTFKNDNKSGNRHWSKGDQAAFLAEPIDSVIRQIEAKLSHSDKNLQVSGGYNGSWYRTDNTLVTALHNNTPRYMSLPLNNEAHQLFLNGGYDITPTTRATVKLEYGVATQDERIPTADIAGLAHASAPKNLDGEVVTTLLQFGVTSKPLPELTLVGNIRHHDVDDKTPAVGVVGPTTNPPTTSVAPYSYTTDSLKLDATYRLPSNISATGGVELKRQDRPVPTVNSSATTQRKVPHRADLDEDTYRLQLRRMMGESLNGSIEYSQSIRSGSQFTLTDAAIQDLINPIHLADRTRDKVRLRVDWAPVESLSIQFSADASQDDYETTAARPYGLRDGNGTAFALDAAYQVTENWKVHGWASHDRTEASQYNTTLGNTFIAKNANLSDKGYNGGFGVSGALGASVKIGANLDWSKTKSSYSETKPGGLVSNGNISSDYTANTLYPLPDVESTMTRISLFTELALNKQSDIRVDLVHEEWKSNDWQWKFANGTDYIYGTGSVDGTVVAGSPNYKSDFIGARYIYKFQ